VGKGKEIVPLIQELTNFFCKCPDSKYFITGEKGE
jgi:hypothetical protein